MDRCRALGRNLSRDRDRSGSRDGNMDSAWGGEFTCLRADIGELRLGALEYDRTGA